MGSAFETNEKAALAKLPLERFAFYHKAKRKVSRDGHTSVNRSFYSVPPEYLGRDVWVRHDSRLVRIFDESPRHITTHVATERGRFQTDPKHIASEKISPIERGISHLHGKMRLIGPRSARWADSVIAGRGVEAARVFQGAQFTSRAFLQRLQDAEVAASMDGRGRALDNVLIERFWRSLQYEEIHLREYTNGWNAAASIGRYLPFYCEERPHQALAYRDSWRGVSRRLTSNSTAKLVEKL